MGYGKRNEREKYVGWNLKLDYILFSEIHAGLKIKYFLSLVSQEQFELIIFVYRFLLVIIVIYYFLNVIFITD